MLENDLLLARFLDAHGAALTAAEAAAFDVLLGLSDGELWDLISGRAEPIEPAEAALAPLLASLRSA